MLAPIDPASPPTRPWPRDALEVLAGALLLIAASLGGTALARFTHLPIPGAVLGLIMMLGALALYGHVPRGLGVAARCLIRHLNLFYIPAAVGISAYTRLLYKDLWPIVAALLLGTWLALAAAAFTYRAVARRLERSGD